MEIREYGNKSSKIVLIQPADEHDIEYIEKELTEIRSRSDVDFLLTTFCVNNWNKDLSPWKANAVFGKEDFGEGAIDTLLEIKRYCDNREKDYYIGGYSLAGLFSLWAVYNSDIFKGVAAASPSMWFPGFDEYMDKNVINCQNVYLSLGDKEEKARNPVMATVGDKIRQAHALLNDKGIKNVLEWNEGNHFRDADIRMAKGFAWLLNMIN